MIETSAKRKEQFRISQQKRRQRLANEGKKPVTFNLLPEAIDWITKIAKDNDIDRDEFLSKIIKELSDNANKSE